MIRKITFLWCFALGLSSTLYAQIETSVTYDSDSLDVKKIEPGFLDPYRNDDAFNYEIVKTSNSWWDEFKGWIGNLFLRFFEWLFGVENAEGFLVVFFRIMPYVLLILLIYVMTKFFLKVHSSPLIHRGDKQGSVHLSEEEYLLKNENLMALIQNAQKNKDYRSAIRYYYLYILRLLTEKELIGWKLQKTNYDYLNELDETEFRQPFREITNLYDHVWYGDFPISEKHYLKAEKTFNAFKASIDVQR